MHGFYILAGYFFCSSYERHGIRKTLNSRILKLGIPLLFVGFTLNTAMNTMSEQRDYSENIFDYIMNGEWLGHLWFIGNLLVYSLVSCLFVRYLLKFPSPIKAPSIQALLLLLGTPLATLCMLFISKVTYAGELIFISFYSLFLYFASYVLGMLLYRFKEAFLVLTNIKFSSMFCLLACAILYMPQMPDSGVLFYYSLNLSGIALSMFLISLCCTFPINNKIIRSVTEASYSIYLLHQPLLVILFPALLFLGLGHQISFILLFTVVFLGCWAFDRNIIMKNRALAFLISGSFLRKINRQN